MGGGAWHPWIFMHGTDIVDKSLILLFFGFTFRWPTPFSADALEHGRLNCFESY